MSRINELNDQAKNARAHRQAKRRLLEIRKPESKLNEIELRHSRVAANFGVCVCVRNWTLKVIINNVDNGQT